MASDLAIKHYDHVHNTPEELDRIKHIVAGSQSCRDAEDAELLLEALGIIPTKFNG